MVVTDQQLALDGTGILELYESGIDMDAKGGAKIYSLAQGIQSLYSGIEVQAGRISLVVTGEGTSASINVEAITGAINKSQVAIRADRIKIDSTSGSSFSIGSDGTMTFNAENAIAAINAATAEINAGKIALNSAGTITLASKLGINASGLLRVDGGAEAAGGGHSRSRRRRRGAP